MAPKKENATIKSENTNTANNNIPAKKRPMKAKKVSPLTSGKLPLVKTNRRSPKPLRPYIGSKVIFIQHMPHGFFEEELAKFFTQFGDVKQVFVARSKRTGRSRGYGYVQFVYPEVARIAASAINNYYMFGRILKAQVVSQGFGDKVPRNLARSMDKDVAKRHAARLNRQVRNENGFFGDPRRQSRRLRQVEKVQKALGELKQAEIELPELPQCFVEVTRLVQHNADAKRTIKPATVKKEEDEENADSSDEEDAFVPLKPSDWVVMASESKTNDEDTAASQKTVKVEKAEESKSKPKKTVGGKEKKKTVGGKEQKKTGKKEILSKPAQKPARKSLRTATSK